MRNEIIYIIASMVLTVLVSSCGVAKAENVSAKNRIINAIIGEAEGEPYKGKVAVACSIKNRVITHGSLSKAMRGVYGERAPRVINNKYSRSTYEQAERAYYESMQDGACDFIDGADHWEGASFKTPEWAKNMKFVAKIGNQKFYRN